MQDTPTSGDRGFSEVAEVACDPASARIYEHGRQSWNPSTTPILPSVGLVDAMRVSPDVGPRYEPARGDLDGASQRPPR